MVITMILMRKVEGVIEGIDKRLSIERRGPKTAPLFILCKQPVFALRWGSPNKETILIYSTRI